MNVDAFLRQLQQDRRTRQQMYHIEDLPSRAATYADLEVDARLSTALSARGVTRFYSHQADAVRTSQFHTPARWQEMSLDGWMDGWIPDLDREARLRARARGLSTADNASAGCRAKGVSPQESGFPWNTRLSASKNAEA